VQPVSTQLVYNYRRARTYEITQAHTPLVPFGPMEKIFAFRHANPLYLISMLLIHTAGSVLQSSGRPRGVILTEMLIILLPGWLRPRARRIPMKTGLRLHPISSVAALACRILDFATCIFNIWLDVPMIYMTFVG
jgi:hypothetical protein